MSDIGMLRVRTSSRAMLEIYIAIHLYIVMSDSEDSTVTYTEALPSPDYVPGPKDPKQAPPLPDFVPEPIYLKFMPLEDEILPAEEQPLPAADSPNADSPGYIPNFDLEEDPTDYPTEGGDDDDDDESSDDDEDNDDDVEEDKDKDEEEEEEHPASTDSIRPPPVDRNTTRISIPVQAPTPFWSEAEIDRLLAIPSPPPSPLSPWSSPLPQIPSPPLPLSPHLPVSSPPLLASPTYPLRYRAAMIRLRAETPSTYYPLPLSTPPSGTPPRPRFEFDESSSSPTTRPTGGFRADYGFVATLDDEIRRDPERELRVRTLCIDRRDHAWTSRLMETEARLSRQAWVQSMDASDTTRAKTWLAEALTLLKTLQTQMETLQGRRGPASGPTHPKAPEEADSHDSGMGARRQALPARECTYQDLMKCKPLYFKGTEGVVELTQWFERMDIVFRISNCTVENQIKFATCTLIGSTLTWWNSHVTTVGPDVAYAMTWTNLRKKMTDKYYPRGEIKKLEELALMCARMFLEESDKIEKYIGGLPDMIHGSVMESKPKTMQDLENNNRGNQGGNGNALAKGYAVGHASTNPYSDIVMGTFLLNNLYASILFDTGADRSFVSTAFSSQIVITRTLLDHYYDVELAHRRIIRLNTILRGCTLDFLNHQLNIDLMPVELGSFHAIIGVAGYYRRFIEGFLKIAKLMTKLTQRGVKFDWGEKQEATYQIIKQKLCSALILALPEGSEDFVVYYDASHKELGDVLMQRKKVITYALRQLKIHEKNYTTHVLELGSIVFL
uniref:Putative reverse transcriptase domain-containing protein n=1 Tax=Tanacetum cinerariifolium TaxID=118510 RepID=A0A6L2J042_TANCI|nr:putative reverse transcriptase domain-containing protein [Tanacetum cinerariifolium]